MGFKDRVASYGLRVTGCGLRVSGCRLRISGCPEVSGPRKCAWRGGMLSRFVLKAFRGLLILISLGLLLPKESDGQTIPVGDHQEEQIRLLQLMHGSDLSSFTNRPVWQEVYNRHMKLESGEFGDGWWNRPVESYQTELPYGFLAGVYNPSIQITANSQVPYGENNAAAWYGRGFSSELQGGLWLTSDYITITFRPHLIRHGNNDFVVPRFIPEDEEGKPLYVSEAIGDIIDRPFRFGPDSYTTRDWGHSSVRAHAGPFEAGYSTEPLWWGANARYPLMMSNNAPGMPHWFTGTREPARIPYVGAFEFRWMFGRPSDSDYFDRDEMFMRDRFFNAINISFSPQWIPNLHIGHSRAFHTYIDEEDGVSMSEIFAVFEPYHLERQLENHDDGVLPARNELRSYYARWVWPDANMEIFAEFLRDGVMWDSRDAMMEPRHHAGYAFGFQKLFRAPLARMYKAHVEFTNLTPSFLQEVRPQTYIYSNEQIPQGHTNRGQLLGAAIGPGSNSQYFALDAYTENGQFGLYLRRLSDNNHFHFEYDRFLDRPEQFRQGFGDYWRHRTDLTIGTTFRYDTGPVLLTGGVSWSRLMNYGRFEYGVFGSGINISTYDPTDKDIENLQFQFGLEWRF